MAFEKAKYDALSQVSEPKDRADIMKIKIETETKETTSTGGSSGAYTPKLSLFSDEAPKTQSKGGEVKETEKIKGGIADNKTIKDIAKKHDKKGYYHVDNMISSLKKQLNKGIKVEMEHTNDLDIAKEIAMDHLTEDPQYYTKLVKAGLASEFQPSHNSGFGDPDQSFNDAARTGNGGLKKGNMHGKIGNTSIGQVDGRNSEPIINKTIDIELEDREYSSLEEAILDEKKRRKKGGKKRKPKPTNPSLWARAKAAARSKFDVYPCVPLDSKALTKNGWKTYEELTIGELILTYNINKDELEWKPILNLNFFENAELVRMYKPTGFSIKCTPNHKWVVQRGNDYSIVELMETKDLPKRARIIVCAELKNNDKILLETFSKTDNWTENIINMSSEQRKSFLAATIIYDGWDKGSSSKIEGRHTFGFVQKNSDHLDAGLLAAYLSGYYVSVHDREYIASASFIRNKKFHSTQNLIIEDDVSEDVWCPTTDNETWVMVQNGFITITGNSAYANGWAAKWYKNRGGGWKSVNEEYIDEASFSDRRIMEKHLSSNNFVLKGGSKHERWEHPSGEVIYLPREKTFADGIVYKTLKAFVSKEGLAEAKLDKKVLTPNQISKKFKVPVKAILKQLNKGQSVEHEHTSSNKTARRIASAHVSEIPDYYNKLSKMEKSKMNERVMSEPHSKNKNKSASRFDASDELVDIYTRDTPGQKKKVLETIKQVIYNKLEEAKTPAWQRKEGKDPKGGLNKKGVASYRAANPGSKLQTAVTTEPSKLKPGSKKAKRRLSFCRRMKGMKNKLTSAKTARDPDSRINKSLRKWNC